MTLRDLVIKTLIGNIAACKHCIELCEAAGNEHGAKRHKERLAEYRNRLAGFR